VRVGLSDGVGEREGADRAGAWACSGLNWCQN
jgi:hypothetical protein